MRSNSEKYDDAMMRALSVRACDLPADSDSSKVRVGGTGSHRVELSRALLDDLSSTWRDTIGAEFGTRTYEELLAEINNG